MWSQRFARLSVILVVLAGAVSVMSGLVSLVWSPDLPAASPGTCTEEPCFDFDLGNASPFAALPLIAHLLLLGLALAMGGVSLLSSVVTAIRRHQRRALAVSAIAVAGPLIVLAGGEVVPHLLNPCVLPDLAGAQPPAFCVSTPEGTDVPDNWHALDHALVGFLPLSLLVAWWWRRQIRRA